MIAVGPYYSRIRDRLNSPGNIGGKKRFEELLKIIFEITKTQYIDEITCSTGFLFYVIFSWRVMSTPLRKSKNCLSKVNEICNRGFLSNRV